MTFYQELWEWWWKIAYLELHRLRGKSFCCQVRKLTWDPAVLAQTFLCHVETEKAVATRCARRKRKCQAPGRWTGWWSSSRFPHLEMSWRAEIDIGSVRDLEDLAQDFSWAVCWLIHPDHEAPWKHNEKWTRSWLAVEPWGIEPTP